jgi:hypothetical protein
MLLLKLICRHCQRPWPMIWPLRRLLAFLFLLVYAGQSMARLGLFS